MLNGKQKRYLRSLGVNMDPIFQVGKGGISDNLILQLSDALEARELIKVRVLSNCEEDAKNIAIQVGAMLKAQVVQVIGKNFLLYRVSTSPLFRYASLPAAQRQVPLSVRPFQRISRILRPWCSSQRS